MLLSLIPFLSLMPLAVLGADLPIGTHTVMVLGQVTDSSSNAKGIFHDGGGGAFQNGYHVQVFADSTTNLNGMGMVHNSVTYSGYVRCLLTPLDRENIY